MLVEDIVNLANKLGLNVSINSQELLVRIVDDSFYNKVPTISECDVIFAAEIVNYSEIGYIVCYFDLVEVYEETLIRYCWSSYNSQIQYSSLSLDLLEEKFKECIKKYKETKIKNKKDELSKDFLLTDTK